MTGSFLPGTGWVDDPPATTERVDDTTALDRNRRGIIGARAALRDARQKGATMTDTPTPDPEEGTPDDDNGNDAPAPDPAQPEQSAG